MEEEQEVAPFKPLAKRDFISSAYAFDERFYNRLKYSLLQERTTSIFRKIIQEFYALLDSLSGRNSLFITSEEHSILEQVGKIIDFLNKQGLKGEAGLTDHRFNDAPHLFSFKLVITHEEGETDGHLIKDRVVGHAFDKDSNLAVSKAIGEFLERYSLTIYRRDNLIRASYEQMRRKVWDVLDPALIAGVASSESEPDLDRSIFLWERAVRVMTGQKVYVPAQLVYWNYARIENEPLLREPNSNGAGGMFTKEGAILSGLYELIQRDAFLIFWLNSIAPPQIDPKTVPDDIFQSILKESWRYGFNVYCFNTTLDTAVPSVVVAVEDPSAKSPYLTVGGGCEASPAKALRRALEEAWAVYYGSRRHPPYSLPENYEPFRDSSVGQGERLRLWANPEMQKHFAFFISGKKKPYSDFTFDYPSGFSSEKEELRFLVERVERLGPGYEVYCYFAKNRLLSRLGYCALKVIVPQFVPLYLKETLAPFGAQRLKEVLKKLGFKPAESFNPWPHPFP